MRCPIRGSGKTVALWGCGLLSSSSLARMFVPKNRVCGLVEPFCCANRRWARSEGNKQLFPFPFFLFCLFFFLIFRHFLFFCCLSHIVQIENCILVLSLVLTTVDFGELFSLFLDGGGRGRCWRVGLFGNAGALKHMFLRASKYAGRLVLPRRVL